MIRDILGLIDCHNSPELGPLTANRPLASTSFLGRYAFMDFCLSNFSNSEISNVAVLVKDHQRSIMKHLGNNTAWLRNTKTGFQQILYNERGILNPPYNHDINNIRENDWVLYSSNASILVFLDPHIVTTIDLRPIIKEHIDRHETFTLVYNECDRADKTFLNENVLQVDESGYLTSCEKNDGKNKKAKVSLGIWILNRTTLADIIKRYSHTFPQYGLKQMLPSLLKSSYFKVHAVEHKGYARCFDSMQSYIDNSFELLEPKYFNQLFNPDWPIYTLTHDTPPALYDKDSEVSSSFIANGCLIQGKVRHSILSRDVKVGPRSVIEDSIILSNGSIGNEVKIKHALVDKYCVITTRQKVVGTKEEPAFLKQGAVL